MTCALTTLPGIRAALIEQCLEVQALGNRVYRTGGEHSEKAAAIRAQARELSNLIRGMQPSAEEVETLDLFFPVHGRKGHGFLNLPGDL